MISKEAYEELKKYRTPHTPSADECDRFVEFRDAGFLKIHHFSAVQLGDFGEVPAPAGWVLTSSGLDALSEFEDVGRQHTQNERDRRFNRKIAIAQVLVPFITFLLGLIVEHFAGLISWIASLF